MVTTPDRFDRMPEGLDFNDPSLKQNQPDFVRVRYSGVVHYLATTEGGMRDALIEAGFNPHETETGRELDAAGVHVAANFEPKEDAGENWDDENDKWNLPNV